MGRGKGDIPTKTDSPSRLDGIDEQSRLIVVHESQNRPDLQTAEKRRYCVYRKKLFSASINRLEKCGIGARAQV